MNAWNARKHHFLRRYMQLFAVGMSKRWPAGLTYVDLFAGPGLCVRDDGTIEDGSPLIALAKPFTRLAFVELERLDVAALRDRIAEHSNGSRAVVIEGDCNDVVSRVRVAMPRGGLTFAFVDPTSWQVRFETIAALTAARRVDLLLTFHVGGMRRVADRDQPRLDQFFGTTSWRPFVGKQKLEASRLLDVYRSQLASIGYAIDASSPAIRVDNSRRAPMYYLVFASKHAKGDEFWRKVVAQEETGQLRLGREH
ncbi:MAG: three-Cys-motif partner protein TcmP [Actinomycetota bacterium]|nr:three-Cys-motif partner protein TcmP [Actinomycetota bacterium]